MLCKTRHCAAVPVGGLEKGTGERKVNSTKLSVIKRRQPDFYARAELISKLYRIVIAYCAVALRP